MAKAESNVDQSKVAGAAQKLAGGGPDTGSSQDAKSTGANIPPAQSTGANAGTGAETQANPPQAPENQSENPGGVAPPFSTGNPGAFKPGAQPQAPTSTERTPAELNAEYGEGYITARRGSKGNVEQTYFTRTAWDGLGKDKGGWKAHVDAPPEVQNLKK